jgi:serine/threonine protein kinase
MQGVSTLDPGTLIAQGTRILELSFQDSFYAIYSAETPDGAKVGITEYFPVDLAERAPNGDVSARSPELNDLFNTGRERFISEAKALAALRHPNLLRFDDLLSDRGTAFALHATEEGQSIANYVKSSKQPPSQEEIDEYLKQLVSALELIHSRGSFHANITPDTVFLRPVPLLVRFGAVRSFLAARMGKIKLAETPGYSAPELHFSDAKAHGPLCDIFSLAAVLYYLVSGRHPIDVIARGLGESMPPLAAIASPKFRTELLVAINRGLELDPERRPPNVKAFGEMLLGGKDFSAGSSRLGLAAVSGGGAEPSNSRSRARLTARPVLANRP